MAFQIEQTKCSCCHMCRTNCPSEAIRFKNAKYWIDPEKCVSCGVCASVCHNGCITDAESQPPVSAPHEEKHYSCDVCVVGGGAGGLVAAAKAADMGASVVLLEKNFEIGGNAWYASGFICYYSSLHKAAGAVDPREKIYKKFMSKTEGKLNGKLVRRLLDANGDWIQWLLDKYELGESYVYDPKHFLHIRQKEPCSWNENRIDARIGPGAGGWFMTLKHKDILEKNGGIILYKTAADKLLTDDSGAVTGVLATDPGGRLRISCKSVILAAGSYSGSREIMDKVQPLFYDDDGKEHIHVFSCPTCTGDGITMSEAIGADIDYINCRVNMFGPTRHPYPAASYNAGEGPMFNFAGEFYDKSPALTVTSPLAHDPKRYLWKILGEKNIQHSIDAEIAKGADANGVDVSPFLKNWKQVLLEEAEEGSIVIADSLPELAKKLGYDAERFVRDIDSYNQSIGQPSPFPPAIFGDGDEDMPGIPGGLGAPAEPVVEGPFYAIKQTLFHEVAVGGISVDENASVLKTGRPVPGLYAAGDSTRGVLLPGDIGMLYIESVFTAMTYALNSGYIAGVEAARFAGV